MISLGCKKKKTQLTNLTHSLNSDFMRRTRGIKRWQIWVFPVFWSYSFLTISCQASLAQNQSSPQISFICVWCGSWKIPWSRKWGSMNNGHRYLCFWETESLGAGGGKYKCQGLRTGGEREIQFRLLCRVTRLRVYCFACRLQSAGNKYLRLRAQVDNEHQKVWRRPQVFGESSYWQRGKGIKEAEEKF